MNLDPVGDTAAHLRNQAAPAKVVAMTCRQIPGAGRKALIADQARTAFFKDALEGARRQDDARYLAESAD